MKFWWGHGILALTLAGCHPGGAGDKPAPLAESVSVADYCESFARTYSQKNALDYQEGSARTRERLIIERWISNLFSPADSRFTAGYKCHFTARNNEGPAQEFSVGMFLTGTLEFAIYTQWKPLQTIPIAYVTDKTTGRAGYGVFKYLDKP